MNGLFPNIVPELSGLLISESCTLTLLDRWHWGHIADIGDGKYAVFEYKRGAYFVGSLDEALERINLEVKP